MFRPSTSSVIRSHSSAGRARARRVHEQPSEAAPLRPRIHGELRDVSRGRREPRDEDHAGHAIGTVRHDVAAIRHDRPAPAAPTSCPTYSCHSSRVPRGANGRTPSAPGYAVRQQRRDRFRVGRPPAAQRRRAPSFNAERQVGIAGVPAARGGDRCPLRASRRAAASSGSRRRRQSDRDASERAASPGASANTKTVTDWARPPPPMRRCRRPAPSSPVQRSATKPPTWSTPLVQQIERPAGDGAVSNRAQAGQAPFRAAGRARCDPTMRPCPSRARGPAADFGRRTGRRVARWSASRQSTDAMAIGGPTMRDSTRLDRADGRSAAGGRPGRRTAPSFSARIRS